MTKDHNTVFVKRYTGIGGPHGPHGAYIQQNIADKKILAMSSHI